jgi:hypothetical protein
LQACFQSLRIVIIGPANDPYCPCLPSLNRLAQEKATFQQASETTAVNELQGPIDQFIRTLQEQIRRLSLFFP